MQKSCLALAVAVAVVHAVHYARLSVHYAIGHGLVLVDLVERPDPDLVAHLVLGSRPCPALGIHYLHCLALGACPKNGMNRIEILQSLILLVVMG